MMQPIQRVPFPGGDSPIPAATEVNGRFRVVIPEISTGQRHRYLWDYSWTN